MAPPAAAPVPLDPEESGTPERQVPGVSDPVASPHIPVDLQMSLSDRDLPDDSSDSGLSSSDPDDSGPELPVHIKEEEILTSTGLNGESEQAASGSEGQSSDDESDQEQAGNGSGPCAEIDTARSAEIYSNLFNEQVLQFFDLHFAVDEHLAHKKQRILHLQASKNTLDGCYYLPKVPRASRKANTVDQSAADAHFSALPGVFWTPTEKVAFFNCLARYSIHRIDHFALHLPQKSSAEIMAYYTLLRQELRSQSKLSPVSLRVPNAREFHHVYEDHFPAGVLYSRLPIAYEVDDEWLAYEEQQSAILTSQDQIQANRAAHRTEAAMRELKDPVDPDRCGLLNPHALRDLTYFYLANQIVPIANKARKARARPLFELLVVLEEIARLCVSEIVADLVYSVGAAGTGTLEIVDDSDKSAIRVADIYRSTEKLKLFEVSGINSRYLDGKTPLLDTYFTNLPDSLKLNMTLRDRYHLGSQALAFMRKWAPVQTENHHGLFGVSLFEPESNAAYSNEALDAAAFTPVADGGEGAVEIEVLENEEDQKEKIMDGRLRFEATWSPLAGSATPGDSDGYKNGKLIDVENAELNGGPNGSAIDFGAKKRPFQQADAPSKRHQRHFNELETDAGFVTRNLVQEALAEGRVILREIKYLDTVDRTVGAKALRNLKEFVGLPVGKEETAKPVPVRERTPLVWDRTFARW